MVENYNKHDVAVYGGYIDDNSLVLQSASGGLGTALAEYMIEQHGYVSGVAYSEDLYSAEYIIVNEKAEIKRLKGSKYIECNKKNILLDVKKLLDAGEKVLFFGLPCMVAALYQFLGNKPENLITCELICHGPTSAKVHRDFVLHLEKVFESKVIEFSVRHKKDKWLPTYLYAKFDNGAIFEKPFYETEYGYAFSVFGREACYQCGFKGNNRQGDIMIGDFWGAEENDPFWNQCGVSVVFAETKKGNDFVCSVPNIKLFPTTFERAVSRNQMVIKSRARKYNRNKFSKLIKKKGLIYAAKHSVNFKRRILRVIKRLIPRNLKLSAYSIYTSIKSKR